MCDYGMEGEGDVSNYIKVGAWLVITAPNLKTSSQSELFDCKKKKKIELKKSVSEDTHAVQWIQCTHSL